MMRSLYSAITGLKNQQTSMDVIGNNIANVNTAGYKRQRASFATMLGQQLRGASAPDSATAPTTGGTNGVSIGLGSVLASVDKVMGQGSSQYTGKVTDMMLQGSGMFVLKLGGDSIFTRTGNFDFDQDGNLIDPSTGALVQGFTSASTVGAGPVVNYPAAPASPWGTTTGSINFELGDQLDATNAPNHLLQSYSIGQDGVVTGIYSDGVTSITRPLFKIAVANFANPGGLTAEGNNYYSESNNSGTADIGSPGAGGRGLIISSYLEMSNVDLSQEFTDMIVTQRGFQANSRVITVSDTLLQELIDLKRN